MNRGTGIRNIVARLSVSLDQLFVFLGRSSELLGQEYFLYVRIDSEAEHDRLHNFFEGLRIVNPGLFRESRGANGPAELLLRIYERTQNLCEPVVSGERSKKGQPTFFFDDYGRGAREGQTKK